MLNKRITALIMTVLVTFASVTAAFAADPTAVSITEAGVPYAYEISGSTIQYPGTIVTVAVHKPGAATYDPSKALNLQNVFVGQTTVESDNTYSIKVGLDADAESGNYTYMVLVTGETTPYVGTFAFANTGKANDVLTVVQDASKNATDVRNILNTNSKDLDVPAGTDYATYTAGEKLYVATGLKTDPAADITELITDFKAEVNKINKVREIVAATEREDIKTLLEDNSVVYLIDASMTEFGSLDSTIQEKTIVELEKTLPGSLYPEDIRDKFAEAMRVAKIPEESPTYPDPDDSDNFAPSGLGGLGGSAAMVTDQNTNPNNTLLTAPESDFSDIDDVEWAKTAITVLSDKGIINGKGDGKFCPNDNLTREELVKLLVEGFGMLTVAENALSFKDVKYGEWYYPYIATAYQLKVANGLSTDNFGVGQPVTRQDMAVFMEKSLKAMGKGYAQKEYTHTFADDYQIADYAKSAVKMFAGEGVLNGKGDNMFDPTGNATRAEAAKVLYTLLKQFNIL